MRFPALLLAGFGAAMLAQPAAAEITFANASYEVSEGASSLSIPVLLTNQDSAMQRVTVNYRTSGPGSAQPPADYITTTGTLIWDQGDAASKSIEIPINEDLSIEGTENFTVTLFSPTGSSLSSNFAANVDIIDNDGVGAGEFQFAITDLLVFENQATASLRVRRLNGSDGPVSVEVTRTGGGTASPGADFSDSATVLSWADGESGEKVFTISIVDDNFVESTETISYVLQNATGGASITRGNATISIGDNDTDGPGAITFLQSTARVIESQGTVQLTVGRFGGAAGFASADYITSSGTADISDYTPVAGTLTWNDGDTSTRTISVPIKDNTLVESDEVFSVTLSPGFGTSLGINPSQTVTIVDDDAPTSTSTISIAQAAYSVDDDDGSVQVQLTRTNPTGTSSVRFTTNDVNATQGSDYIQVGRTVTFNDGDATASVSISILGPSGGAAEGPEAFTVTIDTPSNAVIGGIDTATVNILPTGTGSTQSVIDFIEQDPDSSSYCTGGVSAPTVVINSTEAGALLVLQRGPGSPVAASVSFRALTPCSAQSGADFTLTADTLNWGANDFGSRVIPISVVRSPDDNDPTEEFLVELYNPVGVTLERNIIRVVINPGTGAGATGQVTFVDGNIEVKDSSGPAGIRLRRVGGTGVVTVSYKTVDGSAVAGTNYTAADSSVTWTATDFSDRVVAIPLIVSPDPTPDKSFMLIATVTSGDAEFQGSGAVRVTITSSTADDSKGVGGCSLGRADWISHAFMLTLCLVGLARRRFNGLLRGVFRG